MNNEYITGQGMPSFHLTKQLQERQGWAEQLQNIQ